MTFDDITIDVDPILPGDSRHGYIEFPVVISNSSSDRTHTVSLRFPAPHTGYAPRYSSYSSWLSDLTRTVTVAPGATLRIPLWQPALPIAGNGLQITIDGVSPQEPVPLSSLRQDFYSYGRGDRPCILRSSALGVDPLPVLDNSTKGYGYSRPSAIADIPVTAWSSNRMAYSRYDGIIMTGNEFRSLGADVSGAIQEYVECGGILFLLGSWSIPDRWKECGIGTDSSDIFLLHAGFGTVCSASESDYQKLGTDTWETIERRLTSAQQAWSEDASTDYNRIFPVVDETGIPIRGLFLLIFFYAILIGPVSIFVLSRMKKRIYLLWTVPLLSIITCGVVFLYALVVEGWESRARADVVTWLDESSHRAVTIGWAAYYSPLTPADGFRFAYETEIMTLGVHRYNAPGAGPRSLDWSRDQHLGSNWIMARLPAYFAVRKSETRRERLALRQTPDGRMTVMNGLGAPIKRLWLADRSGNYFVGGSISAGAEGRLSQDGRISKTETRIPTNLDKIYRQAWNRSHDLLTADPREELRLGTYLAELEGTPFLENGLSDIGKNDRSAVVYGLLRGNDREN
ncbi:MAG: hypothetical protein WA705_09755 [Candidatus Ozemobacteraceae bacterium]